MKTHKESARREPKSNAILCSLCGAPMVADVAPGTFFCLSCDFFASRFPVRINDTVRIDEAARERALKPIRLANFQQLLTECADLLPRDATLLDIGCAHGWFIEAAEARGLFCVGIEPDHEMERLATSEGHNVIAGFFPDAMPKWKLFNAISFNDVFEHLPDVNEIPRVLLTYLEPGGIVIVNLHVADGPIFKLTRFVTRLGVTVPLDRMWQIGLPSSHLSYFTANALIQMFEKTGFNLERRGQLQAIATKGLYERIRYDRTIGRLKGMAFWLTTLGARIVIGLWPSDIQYFVFRKSSK